MNPLDLYHQFSSAWERAKSDILAHAILAGILFVCGYRLADPTKIGIDPERILSSNWAKLLGSVGLPITLAALIALALVAYTSLLRTIGRLTATYLFAPSIRSRFNNLDRALLSWVAAALPENQLDARALSESVDARIKNLLLNRPPEIVPMLDTYQRETSDRWTLYQDACFFIVAWPLLPLASIPPRLWLDGRGHPIAVFVLLMLFVLATHKAVVADITKLQRRYLLAVVTTLQKEDVDGRISAKLASRQKIIDRIVSGMIRDSRPGHRPPSLSGYLRNRWPRARALAVRARATRMCIAHKWRRWDQRANAFEYSLGATYENFDWPESYMKWRLVEIGRRLIRQARPYVKCGATKPAFAG